MTTADLIRERLAPLAPDTLEVFDESHEHAGHAGAKEGGGHYQLVIVSREFAGKPAVARHRLVYQALSDLMPSRIHALAIQAYAPEELGPSAQA
ncbi:MAG TPA: BolA family protein [Burkholderiales bacterium]|nr:BolA family protein [Burkholderiales bacterium]